jgi:uncharacterized membrane protein YdjX (TVP38/TMEM64 family)
VKISSATLKRLAVVVGVICLAVVVWSVWDHQAFMKWLERARPIPFFSLLAVLPAFGLPIGPLFVLAGASFGVRIGIIGSLLALAANLAACYWLARRLRPWFDSFLRRFKVRLPEVAQRTRSPARFVLTVKLAPGVPAFVKNYALGLTGAPFGIYFGLGMLITGVYAILLVVLGESLLRHQLTRAIAAGVVVVGLGLFVWLGVRRRQRA